MSIRGRNPGEVNARLAAEVVQRDAEMRKFFIEECFLSMLDCLSEDVVADDLFHRGITPGADYWTKKTRVFGYSRTGELQPAISLLVMPPGTENLDEHTDGFERLRVHFPVPKDFKYTEEDLKQLADSAQDLEMYTEWSSWQDGERRVIRWIISEVEMSRYAAAADGAPQTDEIDTFEQVFADLKGKRLATRGDVLRQIMEDFVNYDRKHQRRKIRQGAKYLDTNTQ